MTLVLSSLARLLACSTLVAAVSMSAALMSGCAERGAPGHEFDTESRGRLGPDSVAQLDRDQAAVVVRTYADKAHELYAASHASALRLDRALRALADDPTEMAVVEARQRWIEARSDYGRTEVLRFYGGPIDGTFEGREGPEMLLNAWPLDEAYIDSTVVGGSAEVPGILQRIDEFPTIDRELLIGLNQVGGEENVATGWHAIEFLLWGQDLDVNGPGNRPLSDWTSDRWAERRRAFLVACSDLLIEQLEALVAAWQADSAVLNYRAEFLALDVEESLIKMLTGVGELARGELAGERMTVAYEERSQEEEHSCFSDNTHADLISNLEGIEMILVDTGFLDLVAAQAPELASRLQTRLQLSEERLASIPAPFDQHLNQDLADSDPGRVAILAGIESLEDLTEVLVSAASAAGLRISVS